MSSSTSETPGYEITKEEWREQGIIMLTRGIIEEAAKCFKKSGDFELYMKAEARLIADRAAKAY